MGGREGERNNIEVSELKCIAARDLEDKLDIDK